MRKIQQEYETVQSFKRFTANYRAFKLEALRFCMDCTSLDWPVSLFSAASLLRYPSPCWQDEKFSPAVAGVT